MNLTQCTGRNVKSALLAIVIAAASGCAVATAETAGTTYFVDPIGGSDANSGTSAKAAWKSLSRASNATLSPGDTLALAASGIWADEVLEITESGTADARITVTRYGNASRDPEVTGLGFGYCFLLRGSYLVLERVRAVGCGYRDTGAYGGIAVWGSNNIVRDNYITGEAVGIFVKDGSNSGSYTGNTLVDNNIENINTPNSNCSTARAVDCANDSGAFGFLIHGDSNEFSWNSVSGSAARSYDWGIDGGALEIFNGNGNRIHHNTSINNNNFSEVGHATGHTATNNAYSYNVIRATCGRMCDEARGLIVRGGESRYGPNTGTIFAHNTFYSDGATARGITCHAGCSPGVLTLQGNIIVVTSGATGSWSVWSDAPFAELYNVLNGPYTGFTKNNTTSTATAGFVNAPTDLHIAASSPGVDRAGLSSFAYDLDRNPVGLDGNCNGGNDADSGAYEFQPSRC